MNGVQDSTLWNAEADRTGTVTINPPPPHTHTQKLVPRPWNEERQAIPYSPLVRVACGQLASREPSLKEELTPINFQPLPTVVDSRL